MTTTGSVPSPEAGSKIDFKFKTIMHSLLVLFFQLAVNTCRQGLVSQFSGAKIFTKP
jgi:hypothetical protein